jgi:hypothetical protein
MRAREGENEPDELTSASVLHVDNCP